MIETCQLGKGYAIYFDAVISPVAVVAAGHRTMYKTDLRSFDVLSRKLLRSVVGPPAAMDWTRPWHEILHDWNGRVNEFAAHHGIKLWSERCVQQHWDLAHYIPWLKIMVCRVFGQYWQFAHYISNLPRERWVVRAMNWFPENARRVGRPAYIWDSMIQHFCRHKQIGNWRKSAQNFSFWMSQFDDFLSFTDT